MSKNSFIYGAKHIWTLLSMVVAVKKVSAFLCLQQQKNKIKSNVTLFANGVISSNSNNQEKISCMLWVKENMSANSVYLLFLGLHLANVNLCLKNMKLCQTWCSKLGSNKESFWLLNMLVKSHKKNIVWKSSVLGNPGVKLLVSRSILIIKCLLLTRFKVWELNVRWGKHLMRFAMATCKQNLRQLVTNLTKDCPNVKNSNTAKTAS